MNKLNFFFSPKYHSSIHRIALFTLFVLLFTAQVARGQKTQPDTLSDDVKFSAALHDVVDGENVEKIRRFLKAHPHLSKANKADLSAILDDMASETSMSLTISSNSTGYGTASSNTEPVDPKSLKIEALLIAYGASVNPDSNRTAPLLGAVNGQKWSLAKLLVERGARVNVSVQGNIDNGMTPLHFAAYYNNAEFAKILIDHKALINAKDSDGYTPLHTAASNGRIATAVLLLANKANVNDKNNDGDTPLGLAVKNRHKNMAALLRQHGGHK